MEKYFYSPTGRGVGGVAGMGSILPNTTNPVAIPTLTLPSLSLEKSWTYLVELSTQLSYNSNHFTLVCVSSNTTLGH